MMKIFLKFQHYLQNVKFARFERYIRLRWPFLLRPSLYILLATLLFIVLQFPYTATVQTFDLPKLGYPAKETVIAPFTYDIIRSPEELEWERKKATDQVLMVLDYDNQVRKIVQKRFNDLKRSLTALVSKENSDSAQASIRLVMAKELSENTISSLNKKPELLDVAIQESKSVLETGVTTVLLVPDLQQLAEVRSRYNTSFGNYLIYSMPYVSFRRDSIEKTIPVGAVTVKEIALENAMKRLRDTRKYNDDALNAVYEILFTCISANVEVNNSLMKLRREKAAQDVLEISGKVIRDTEIVRKHQEVTPEVIQKLRSLRIAIDRMENGQEERKARAGNLGRLLLTLIPLLFAALYIRKKVPALSKNSKHLIALALLLCLQFLIIRIGLSLTPHFQGGTREISSLIPEYLIPISLGSLLAAILFGLEISLIVSLYTSIVFGILMGFNQYFFLYSFLGAIFAGFFGRNIRYRLHFFKIIIPVVLINIVVILLWHIIGFKFSFLLIMQNIGYSLISVATSVFLAMVFTPLFEKLFDISTDMTLVELSDMNHPILKRLSIEAAGTYNHSVLVGNLAESAAQRIGANPLLVRVASYYHDIGKIEKSDYFVENCLTLDKNRHNKLTPSMSALIICAHVKDGVELARKFKLPKVIQDIIMQHHGNSMVSFFFEKALEQDPHKQVQEQDYCYPGPVPQTREAAIIMLADSVEAAARSLGTSSPKLLRELVKKIIRDKFLSSQLEQCDLTLRDLNEITEGFMPVLQGMFHSRIEYPSREKGAQ